MSEHAIEVGNLMVRYGRVTAGNDVTLNVPRGSVYALLGRNGAGIHRWSAVFSVSASRTADQFAPLARMSGRAARR